ncbi:MAG: LysR family transcriptional regulator, partial [bacterium]
MNLKNITLHQLRLFSSLGKHLSFTRVAEELHLTQPAVSIQIKRLEENIGIPLVEQMGKQIYLTDAGKYLFEAASEILNRLETMNEDISDMDSGIKGALNLAGITTAKFFMPHLLGSFLREFPLVEPSLTITNQSRILSRLRENLDEIVIMGRIPDNMDLKAHYFLD